MNWIKIKAAETKHATPEQVEKLKKLWKGGFDFVYSYSELKEELEDDLWHQEGMPDDVDFELSEQDFKNITGYTFSEYEKAQKENKVSEEKSSRKDKAESDLRLFRNLAAEEDIYTEEAKDAIYDIMQKLKNIIEDNK